MDRGAQLTLELHIQAVLDARPITAHYESGFLQELYRTPLIDCLVRRFTDTSHRALDIPPEFRHLRSDLEPHNFAGISAPRALEYSIFARDQDAPFDPESPYDGILVTEEVDLISLCEDAALDKYARLEEPEIFLDHSGVSEDLFWAVRHYHFRRLAPPDCTSPDGVHRAYWLRAYGLAIRDTLSVQIRNSADFRAESRLQSALALPDAPAADAIFATTEERHDAAVKEIFERAHKLNVEVQGLLRRHISDEVDSLYSRGTAKETKRLEDILANSRRRCKAQIDATAELRDDLKDMAAGYVGPYITFDEEHFDESVWTLSSPDWSPPFEGEDRRSIEAFFKVERRDQPDLRKAERMAAWRVICEPLRRNFYPPIGMKLEDRHVGWLIENWEYSTELLHKFWPADFLKSGLPPLHRPPCGLPYMKYDAEKRCYCAVVVGKSYVLCGSGYLVHNLPHDKREAMLSRGYDSGKVKEFPYPWTFSLPARSKQNRSEKARGTATKAIDARFPIWPDELHPPTVVDGDYISNYYVQGMLDDSAVPEFFKNALRLDSNAKELARNPKGQVNPQLIWDGIDYTPVKPNRSRSFQDPMQDYRWDAWDESVHDLVTVDPLTKFPYKTLTYEQVKPAIQELRRKASVQEMGGSSTASGTVVEASGITKLSDDAVDDNESRSQVDSLGEEEEDAESETETDDQPAPRVSTNSAQEADGTIKNATGLQASGSQASGSQASGSQGSGSQADSSDSSDDAETETETAERPALTKHTNRAKQADGTINAAASPSQAQSTAGLDPAGADAGGQSLPTLDTKPSRYEVIKPEPVSDDDDDSSSEEEENEDGDDEDDPPPPAAVAPADDELLRTAMFNHAQVSAFAFAGFANIGAELQSLTFADLSDADRARVQNLVGVVNLLGNCIKTQTTDAIPHMAEQAAEANRLRTPLTLPNVSSEAMSRVTGLSALAQLQGGDVAPYLDRIRAHQTDPGVYTELEEVLRQPTVPDPTNNIAVDAQRGLHSMFAEAIPVVKAVTKKRKHGSERPPRLLHEMFNLQQYVDADASGLAIKQESTGGEPERPASGPSRPALQTDPVPTPKSAGKTERIASQTSTPSKGQGNRKGKGKGKAEEESNPSNTATTPKPNIKMAKSVPKKRATAETKQSEQTSDGPTPKKHKVGRKSAAGGEQIPVVASGSKPKHEKKKQQKPAAEDEAKD